MKEDIKYPAGRNPFFAQYYHTIATIDAHISARLWAQHHDAEVIMFDTYHEVVKANKERVRSKTQFILNDGTRIIPDASLMIERHQVPTLYILEVYR